MTERGRWYLLLVLPPLFWAGNALVGRAVVGQIPPLGFSFWRWVLAFLLLLPFTFRHLVAAWPTLRANAGAVIAMGIFSVGAYNTLLYLALQTTTAINATLVSAIMPMMILVLGRLWLKQPIRRVQAAGILISTAGVLGVVTQGEPQRLGDLHLAPGDGLMLLASLSWAVYSVMLRRHPLPLGSFTLLTAFIGVGVVAILPFYLWEVAAGHTFAASLPTLGAIAYTAVFASLAAYYFWNRGIAAVGAAAAGQYSNLIPLFTAALAVVFLGEEFRWFHALGGALIFAGLGLAAMPPRRQGQ